MQLRVGIVSRLSLLAGVVLAAWTAAYLTWQLQQPPMVFPAPRPSEIQLPVSADDPAKLIGDAHLFGIAQQAPKPKPKVVQRKPSTSLTQYELLGLLALGDGSGNAIIQRKGEPEPKMYRPGDALADVGEIERIESQQVLVDVGGVLESLQLKQLDLNQTRAVPPTVDELGFGFPQQPGAGNLSDRQMQQVKKMMEQDPGKLGRHFRATPRRRDGETIGYAVRSTGAYGAVFRQIGLRNGDIVTEVNGIPLDGSANALRAYQSVLESKQVFAKVSRGDRELNLSQSLP